jgi:hypoxanthine phosphoribosyltransferase|uniref:Phosphoribosyltransferase domain-containing protein n=1 Tax=Eutreptiella gymnastica TaxID=73025 RepID=A0A7S4LJX8_9EUGL
MAGLVALSSYHNYRKPEIRHPKLEGGNKEESRVTYIEVHKLVARTAKQIKTFRPEVILGIGGGGYIPARILRTYIPEIPVLAVTLNFYCDVTLEVRPEPKIIQWIDAQTADEYIKGKRVLLVDDIDDTRITLSTVLAKLSELTPAAVGVFVLHSKKKDYKAPAEGISEWFVGAEIDNHWVEYPWDAIDVDKHHAR